MKLKLLNILLLLAGSELFFVSCNNNDELDDSSASVTVQFGSQIGELNTRTIAGGDQWAANDKIGIFMLNHGQPLDPGNISGGAENSEYRAETGGNAFTSFFPVGNDIYYPVISKVDFIAYYPYQLSLTDYCFDVDMSNQSVPEGINVLYAHEDNENGYDKKSGTVNLKFKHLMSKLSFVLIPGKGLSETDLIDLEVRISSFFSAATVNLKQGDATANGSVTDIILNTAVDGQSGSAIIAPQTVHDSRLIVELSNGDRFEWEFPPPSEFVAGKNHQYKITVSKTGIELSNSGITDWTGTGDPPVTGGFQRGYKVGDYYPDPNAVYENGILKSGTAAIGVVFWLDNHVIGDHPYSKIGEHGKIVGLYEQEPSNWNETWANNYGTTYNAGTGWHMPIVTEINYLYCSYNGMEYEVWNDNKPTNLAKNHSNRAWFRSKLTNAGGNSITDSWYWIAPNMFGNSRSLHFNSGNIRIAGGILQTYKSRAIKPF